MMAQTTSTAQPDAVIPADKESTTQPGAVVLVRITPIAQTGAVVLTRITSTSQTDTVVLVDKKSTAHNDAITQQRKSTSSALVRIPPEILRMIAEFLPEKNAACFTLCCHSIKDVLGERYLKAMTIPPYEQFDFSPKGEIKFVHLLARDLPQHFACFECSRIHRARTIKWPSNTKEHLGCAHSIRSRQNAYSLTFFSPFKIYFAQVYLVMKQHRLGIDLGFPLEAFRHVEITHEKRTNVTNLMSVDARFVSNELLLRSQIWILFPPSQKDRMIQKLSECGLPTRLCAHSARSSLEEMVAGLVGNGGSLIRTVQCHHCWMDFGIRRKYFGEAGTAFIITRWINLGAGLDPEDRKWQGHIGRKGLRSRQRLVNIRKTFEDQEGSSMEEFTSDNQQKLLSEWRSKYSNSGADDVA
ncbi:hypothetical protein BELL_0003g00150 [Botrytis elliptica]|uniref:F-box domain-containing protein n=1 Tax=Botrytis elliptica TaxID=278938 RepID=A0A4Z1K4R1_9HELO|nr:hypothetical protein BELL_0003g00150 [Botrytis elliptica]